MKVPFLSLFKLSASQTVLRDLEIAQRRLLKSQKAFDSARALVQYDTDSVMRLQHQAYAGSVNSLGNSRDEPERALTEYENSLLLRLRKALNPEIPN